MKKLGAVDILTPNFADLGAQRVAINAANGLVARGYPVRMVVCEAVGPFVEYLDKRVDVLELRRRWLDVPKLRILGWYLAYAWCFGRGARVVIALSPGMNLLAIWLRILLGHRRVKVVIQEHGLMSAVLLEERAMGTWFAPLYRWLYVPLYRWADLFVTIAKAIAEDHVANFGTAAAKVRLIPNPVDVPVVQMRAAEPLPADAGWEERDVVRLVAVGRLAVQKGFGRLLRWFAAVHAVRPQVRLTILGQGVLEGELRAQIRALGLEKVVQLAGFRTNPYAWMARAEMFVLTSDWEGLPQVIAEAMVCGTCVVAHACPSGPDEMIVDGVTGRLVDFDDEKAWVKAVVEMVDAPALRKKLAKAGQAWAVEAYALETFVDRYEALITELNAA